MHYGKDVLSNLEIYQKEIKNYAILFVYFDKNNIVLKNIAS